LKIEFLSAPQSGKKRAQPENGRALFDFKSSQIVQEKFRKHKNAETPVNRIMYISLVVAI
jgi:hypothetical protein